MQIELSSVSRSSYRIREKYLKRVDGKFADCGLYLLRGYAVQAQLDWFQNLQHVRAENIASKYYKSVAYVFVEVWGGRFGTESFLENFLKSSYRSSIIQIYPFSVQYTCSLSNVKLLFIVHECVFWPQLLVYNIDGAADLEIQSRRRQQKHMWIKNKRGNGL